MKVSKENNRSAATTTFNYKLVKRGVIIFVTITLIAFTGLFIFSSTEESLAELKNIRPGYILIILALVFFDWWIGGWRNTIFVRKVIPNVSQRICFDANLANIFMGAVTPSQTGGGPIHLYMLHRRGVKLADGIALSVINFISTIIFFITSTGIGLRILRDSEINDTLYSLIKSGFSIFTTLFLFILLGLVAPHFVGRILAKMGRMVDSLSHRLASKISSAIDKTKSKLFEYNHTIRTFLFKNPLLLPYSLVLTIIMYSNKFLVTYMIVLGLGYTGDLAHIMAIQAITFFLLYFAPTPGGSGIAEFSIASLMTPFIPGAGIASFTVLHRSFLLILPAIVGSFIVMKELKKHSDHFVGTPDGA